MSNGGKSVLQDLADALAILTRVQDQSQHAHPSTTRAIAMSHVNLAAVSLTDAMRALLGKANPGI